LDVVADNGYHKGIAGNLEVFFTDLGDLTGFTGEVIRKTLKKSTEYKEFVRQCYLVGYRSLPLVGITALILGLVLTLQMRPVMDDLGAESWLPGSRLTPWKYPVSIRSNI
jgi:phospholipid/cholesterol/gamma-HCH transport system permease protein